MSSAWSHNRHYHGLLLSVVPADGARALDVGCGDGTFVRLLATRAGHVVGIDSSGAAIERARTLSADCMNVTYVRGDVLTTPLDGPYDYVAAIASLHQMDLPAALARMRALRAASDPLRSWACRLRREMR